MKHHKQVSIEILTKGNIPRTIKVDKGIEKLIQDLNRAGIYTEYSCIGGRTFTAGYIMFQSTMTIEQLGKAQAFIGYRFPSCVLDIEIDSYLRPSGLPQFSTVIRWYYTQKQFIERFKLEKKRQQTIVE